MLIFENSKSEHENDFNIFVSISSRVCTDIPLGDLVTLECRCYLLDNKTSNV